MAFPVGSNKSAFAAPIAIAELRNKEAQKKLEHDFEALIRNSEETIKKLQEEIGVLRKEIVVLQSRAKENETTKIALI
jgi:glutaredoxin 2